MWRHTSILTFLASISVITCNPVSEPAYRNSQYAQAIPTIQYKPQQQQQQQRPVYETRADGLQYYKSQNAIQTQGQAVQSLVLPAQVAPGHQRAVQAQGQAVQSLVLPAQIAPSHGHQPQPQRTIIQTQSQPIHKLLLGGTINPDLLRPRPEPTAESQKQAPAPIFYEQILKAQQAAQASFRQSAQQVAQKIEAAQKYQAEQAKARAQAQSQQQQQQPLYYQPQPQQQPIKYVQPQVKYVTRPVEQPAAPQQPLYSARIPQQEEKEDEGDFDHNPSYQFGFDVKDDQFTNYQQRKEQRDGNVIKGSYSVVDADGYIRTVQYTADPKEGFKAEVTREPTNIQIVQPRPAEPQYAQQPQPQPQAQAYRPQYARPQQRSVPEERPSNVGYRYQQ